jgi:antitoxin component YwqK of YwqJK toxin-antitoxin module
MSYDNLYYPSGALYAQRSEEMREYYYENGQLKTLERCKEGRLDGETLLYWLSGALKRKCFFILGVREGLDQIWNEAGILIDEGSYERGRPVGVHRRWTQSGLLMEEITYFEPHRFDLRQWDEKGALRVEALWIDPANYKERVWDELQDMWVEKEGWWNGKKLIYL